MKYNLILFIVAMSMLSLPVFSQKEKEPELLGLAGDNLDLAAVLDLFQKSKTIEEFEKELNLEKTGINNLDLNLDKKVDFIKVVTTKKDDDFTFVLQVAVSEKETQDVAVILLSKEKEEMTLQIVGDKELYGKDYVIEPVTKPTPAVTPNPAYTGTEPVPEAAPATTTVVQVQSAPIVQYVYSPAYVPYYPPYYYGYYPPYYAAWGAIAVGIYWGAAFHYGGYGGYGYHNTTVIHNHNNYNNYNGHRNGSDYVSHHNANGSYGNGNRGSNGASASTRPANGGASASTRPANGGASASTRPSNGASTRPSNGASASTRPSNGASASRPSTGPVNTTKPSNSASTRPSTGSTSSRPSSSSTGASRNMNSGGYNGGGASRGGGGYSGGGGSRGGGGGGGRRR